MKSLVCLFFLGSIGLMYTSCAKDRTPNVVFDPTCSDTISFSQDILPLFQENCISCHDEGNATPYTFTNYSNISNNALDAVNAMRGDGFQQMPQDSPPLPDSLIKILNCWIQNQTPNN
jgi:hypothetical protein